jgi:hypothetical protein
MVGAGDWLALETWGRATLMYLYLRAITRFQGPRGVIFRATLKIYALESIFKLAVMAEWFRTY